MKNILTVLLIKESLLTGCAPLVQQQCDDHDEQAQTLLNSLPLTVRLKAALGKLTPTEAALLYALNQRGYRVQTHCPGQRWHGEATHRQSRAQVSLTLAHSREALLWHLWAEVSGQTGGLVSLHDRHLQADHLRPAYPF